MVNDMLIDRRWKSVQYRLWFCACRDKGHAHNSHKELPAAEVLPSFIASGRDTRGSTLRGQNCLQIDTPVAERFGLDHPARYVALNVVKKFRRILSRARQHRGLWFLFICSSRS